MVFDAEAKSSNESLNSNLYAGPDLLNSLIGVLRFRKYRIAVVADVEAFHQVRLKPEDAVRFLWKNNPKSNPLHQMKSKRKHLAKFFLQLSL